MHARKKIILYSMDPGGANVISSIYFKLKNEYDVIVYGKEYAIEKYKQFQIPYKQFEFENVDNWLEFEKPDLIITGTSGNSYIEKNIWKSSKQKKIKTIAVLDQWMNYKIRFSGKTLLEIQDEKPQEELIIPDLIFAMDDFSKDELINIGIPENYIEVIGHPYFSFLYNLKFEKKNQKNFLQDEVVILYGSEPISDTYGDICVENSYWGYNEISIFKELINALEILIEKYNMKLVFKIRKHPKEKNDFFEIFINDYSGKMKIVLDRSKTSILSILESDVVIGMSSMILFEAMAMEKPVLSVQIGLKRENPLFLDKRNILKSIITSENLKNSIEEIFNKKEDVFIQNANFRTFIKEYCDNEKFINKVRDFL